jgi:hypothetical protein
MRAIAGVATESLRGKVEMTGESVRGDEGIFWQVMLKVPGMFVVVGE